jgi:predicted TIM-barrel fold metal-dependent hydrolase
MDKEGLDVAALYPSIGLGIMMREDMDPKLGAAIARAYNNWLYEFCQTDPKRMKGVAMISLHDVTEAVKEAQRTVAELGFVGVFARPEPLRSLPWHSRYYDILWSALEELGVPLGFHSAAASGELPQVGDRFGDDLLLRHICSHPMENMLAMVDIICGGVLERHPKLKVAFLECYSGWVSFWLNRMDNRVGKLREAPITKMKPSEYFKRQCWIATEAERELAMLTQLFGDDNIVFSTDYPHGDSDFPHAVDELLEIEGVSNATKKKILWDNCARLYEV